METLLIALGAGLGFIIAYHTYGRWLGNRIFALSASAVCPSHRLSDGADYVPTRKAVIFGHHFTSIAGTGPIVGPAIAVMWGWLPALIWVVLGSIFIGAVHDLGALIVSMRHNGQTIGDVAGRVLNRRVRILFLLILFMGLTIVLAIFGLVIATVFRQYPASIFPCTVQIPIAVAIGVWLHRRGASLLVPSIIALALMYLTVVIGDKNFSTDLPVLAPLMRGLHAANAWMASWSNMTWVIVLLLYSYVASVLPVWLLLQPRDYINSLQLLSAMGLIVLGLVVAAAIGGAPPVEGAARQPLEIVAPMWNPHPAGAPMIFPFLFITIACGAVSGFHCLVSSGTSSKQIDTEPDARFVGYGSMLTEGFLATLVIVACVAGLGLGITLNQTGRRSVSTSWVTPDGRTGLVTVVPPPLNASTGLLKVLPPPLNNLNEASWFVQLESTGAVKRYGRELGGAESNAEFKQHELLTLGEDSRTVHLAFDQMGLAVGVTRERPEAHVAAVGPAAWQTRYRSWAMAGGLGSTVGAFVDGSANLLRAAGIPVGVAVALMGVLVASFAGTTLDTACRLQRYVVQELAATFLPHRAASACPHCGYTLWQHETSPHSRGDAAFAPEGRRNVATGGASREATSATRGNGTQKHFRPGGAAEAHEGADALTCPSPLRGDDDRAHTPHGLRDAQSSIAPPVATPHRPAGTEDNACAPAASPSPSRSNAAFAPEGRRNVATGGANPEGMSGTRGDDAPRHSSPGGATETTGAREQRTTRSPLRGDDDRAHTSHGFRDAQGGVAPPAATFAGPSGAEDSAGFARPFEIEDIAQISTAIIQCPECGELITPEQIEHAGRSMPRNAFNMLNPVHWLTNKHGATVFAIVIATVLAALPPAHVAPGFWETLMSSGPADAWTWMATHGGKGGLFLWPLFGATNQLLAGLSFIVITLYLWRRRKPLWFLVLPMVFMLIMPLWAMSWQVFIGNADNPRWLMPDGGTTNWSLALIGIASIAIEIWMVVEALLVSPRVRGIVEQGATDVAPGAISAAAM